MPAVRTEPTHRAMTPRAALSILLAGMALVVAFVFVATTLPEPVSYHGTHVDPALPAADFTLESADGPVSLETLRGKVVVLFFGYTSCPDVCPTTLLRLDAALAELDEDLRDRVQVVFVSVDPERDSPQRASSYARSVNPSFLGLSGTPAAIADVASRYGIYHAKAEGSEATGYLVDHTVTMPVINAEGGIELYWAADVAAPQIADDLATLLRRG